MLVKYSYVACSRIFLLEAICAVFLIGFSFDQLDGRARSAQSAVIAVRTETLSERDGKMHAFHRDSTQLVSGDRGRCRTEDAPNHDLRASGKRIVLLFHFIRITY